MDSGEYRKLGFVLVPNLFSLDEVGTVRADAVEVFRTQMIRCGIPDADCAADSAAFARAMFTFFGLHEELFVECAKQAQHLISLHRLALDERIVTRLHELGLTRPNVNTRPVIYFNSRHLAREDVYWRVDAHQDWRSMQGSLDGIVVWVPLVDVDARLGALEVVPGSHRHGLVTDKVVNGFGMTHRFPDEAFMPIETKAGDALFFSSFLVHRSGNNSTADGIRWSCHFRFNNLDEPTFIGRGYPHSFTYRGVTDLITPGFPKQVDLDTVFPSDLQDANA